MLPFSDLPMTDATIGAWIGSFLWPMVRIGGFFMVVSFFGAQTVPTQVKVGLTLLTTVLVAPLLPEMPPLDALTVNSWLIVAHQLLIGVALGFIVKLLLEVFVLFGQVIAMQIGLGMAQMNDPVNGISSTVLSQYMILATNLMFLATNGHIVVLDTLIESFHVIPVGAEGFTRERAWLIAQQGSWLFSGGVIMALPILVAKLIVNGALGIATRAAPQLNIFTLGFPVMMIMGLFELWVWMSDYLFYYDRMARDIFELMRNWIGVP